MKKLVSSFVALASLVLTTAMPVMADNEPLDKVVGCSLIPVRLAGVAVGVVGGTPVAALRQSLKAYKDWTPGMADHVGGKDFGPSMGACSLFTIPGALVWGGLTGPYYGIKNGVTDGWSNPFTHQSFCMDSDYTGGSK